MTSGRRARAQRDTGARGDPMRPSARLQAVRARRRRQTWWAISVGVVAAAGSGLALSLGGGSSNLPLASVATLGHLASPGSLGPPGPEGVPVPQGPVLAPAGSPAPGQSIDGIACQSSEQVVFHVHTHLAVFVGGKARQIPYGIGIAPPRQLQSTPEGPFVTGGGCFSWLHTHAADGIIHVESPSQRSYTLGEFFDIWGQALGPDQVGPATGKVTAFYDGKVYLGNPRDIPIGDHVQVQLDVGRPVVAPESIQFPSGL